MFECIEKYGRLGLKRNACLLLLALATLFSVPVRAQEAGGDNVLSGMSGMTGMSLGGGMSTDISNIADICANALDKAACAKKLAATQTRTLQATPDANLASQRPATNPKTPRPPQTNEFQEFITASVGKKLSLFGYNLFEGSPDTFAPVDNIPVTQDYLIGPGDEIVITAWGQVDINIHAMVNRNGSIDLPKVGNVDVAGVRYQNLQNHLKNAIGHVYRNFDLNVSLGKLRSIQVFVVGQAMQPGVYTVSSLSTLVNTLFASGGPSVNGSMRHIQVKRNGVVISELDLYELLLKGDKTKDISLLPGDVIYIPPVKQVVAIYGGVNNPAIYELKDDKTTLSDLLQLAGGMTTTASSGKKVLLERIYDRKVRKVDEFSLDTAGLTRMLKDGDLVKVQSIDARFDNAVTLRGNVANPGRYPWKEGMRVKDLIPDMDSLIVPEYWLKQNEYLLKHNQSVQLSASGQNLENGQNGQYGLNVKIKPEEKEKQDVKHSVAEINWDYAVINRLKKDDLTGMLIPFNLGKAISGEENGQNMLLQPGDTITIFSKDDIQVPRNKRNLYVRLEGEVNNAGIYQALPGETLRQIVARVGGLTPNAYLFGAELDRESVRSMQQQKMKEMIDRMEESVNQASINKVQSSSSAEDAAITKSQEAAQAALIARLRKVQATGRVVLEIPVESSQIKDLPDLVLEDGDHLLVPPRSAVVSVMGMVYNQSSFMYRPGKSIRDYLDQAGGPTRDADEARMYLLRADGSLVSAQKSSSLLSFNSFSNGMLEPGDSIVVPEMLDKFVLSKELKDWTQVFYQFAMGAAGLKVLGL